MTLRTLIETKTPAANRRIAPWDAKGLALLSACLLRLKSRSEAKPVAARWQKASSKSWDCLLTGALTTLIQSNQHFIFIQGFLNANIWSETFIYI